jgi:antitoxin HicB
MVDGIAERVAYYLSLPYRMEIYQDDGTWAAEFPELPGLVAGHETWDGLQAAIDDAKRTYFEAALEHDLPIAEPNGTAESFSGRVLVRLPKTIHRDLARAAEFEGVSLNTWILTTVAKGLGGTVAQQSGRGPTKLVRPGRLRRERPRDRAHKVPRSATRGQAPVV